IVSNSDGGNGYSSERFQNAFSQSRLPLLHQLDAYHIAQAINRTFGYQKSELKDKIKKALKVYDLDEFKLVIDTHESKLEDDKEIEKLNNFRTYILNHWDYVQDWRKRMPNAPRDARSLGCMESNQRKISFRMKNRGMHWSKAGAESMV